PLPNPAGDCDDAFAAQRRRLVESLFRRIRRVEDRLCPPFAVADVDEDESAEIAAGMDPAGQSDGLPDLRRAQFVAMMRALHSGTSSLVASFRESAAYRVPKVLATIRRRIHNRAHARQTSGDVGVESHG